MTAQVVEITETVRDGNPLDIISWDWACTEAGVVSGSITVETYDGIVLGFEMIPDGGDDTPTAAYTATVKDGNGVDVLHGLGVGSATATATVSKVFGDGLGFVITSRLTLAIAAAGDANKGVLNLYIGKP